MLIAAPFASAADLASRWRTLTSGEEASAGVLLADASSLILDECPTADLVADDDAAALAKRTATLKRIVCAMVKRAMVRGADEVGVQTSQTTAGPFSQSQTYSNPTGDLYLTKAERRALPCGRGRAFMVDMIPPVVEE